MANGMNAQSRGISPQYIERCRKQVAQFTISGNIVAQVIDNQDIAIWRIGHEARSIDNPDHIFQGHTDQILKIQQMASLSLDGTIRIWDADNLQCTTLRHSDFPHALFKKEENYLITASSSGLKAWKYGGECEVSEPKYSIPLPAIKDLGLEELLSSKFLSIVKPLNDNNQYSKIKVIVFVFKNTIYLWQIKSVYRLDWSHPLAKLSGHEGDITQVALLSTDRVPSPHNHSNSSENAILQTYISASEDHTLRLWTVFKRPGNRQNQPTSCISKCLQIITMQPLISLKEWWQYSDTEGKKRLAAKDTPLKIAFLGSIEPLSFWSDKLVRIIEVTKAPSQDSQELNPFSSAFTTYKVIFTYDDKREWLKDIKVERHQSTRNTYIGNHRIDPLLTKTFRSYSLHIANSEKGSSIALRSSGHLKIEYHLTQRIRNLWLIHANNYYFVFLYQSDEGTIYAASRTVHKSNSRENQIVKRLVKASRNPPIVMGMLSENLEFRNGRDCIIFIPYKKKSVIYNIIDGHFSKKSLAKIEQEQDLERRKADLERRKLELALQNPKKYLRAYLEQDLPGSTNQTQSHSLEELQSIFVSKSELERIQEEFQTSQQQVSSVSDFSEEDAQFYKEHLTFFEGFVEKEQRRCLQAIAKQEILSQKNGISDYYHVVSSYLSDLLLTFHVLSARVIRTETRFKFKAELRVLEEMKRVAQMGTHLPGHFGIFSALAKGAIGAVLARKKAPCIRAIASICSQNEIPLVAEVIAKSLTYRFWDKLEDIPMATEESSFFSRAYQYIFLEDFSTKAQKLAAKHIDSLLKYITDNPSYFRRRDLTPVDKVSQLLKEVFPGIEIKDLSLDGEEMLEILNSPAQLIAKVKTLEEEFRIERNARRKLEAVLAQQQQLTNDLGLSQLHQTISPLSGYSSSLSLPEMEQQITRVAEQMYYTADQTDTRLSPPSFGSKEEEEKKRDSLLFG